MKTEAFGKHMFQIALLAVLCLIALGIWYNRLSNGSGTAVRNEAGNATGYTGGYPVGNAANSGGQLPSQGQPFGGVATGSNGSLYGAGVPALEAAVKANDYAKIREACYAARRQSDNQFLLKAFRLACDHGSIDSLRAIDSTVGTPTAHDIEELLAGVNRLIDRGEDESLRYVFGKFSQMGVPVHRVVDWTVNEFNREPWDSQRFQKIVGSMPNFNFSVPKLLPLCLTGPIERYEWMKQYLKQSTNSNHQAELGHILANPATASAENVDRIIGFLDYTKSNNHVIVANCAAYLQPKHLEAISHALKGNLIEPQVLTYIIKQPVESVKPCLDSDSNLRTLITRKINETLGRAEPSTKLEELNELVPWIQWHMQQEAGCEPYANLIGSSSPRLEWLWKHGVRPSPSAGIEARLFLAIRFKDRQLLGQVLSVPSSELSNLLNKGIRLIDARSGSDRFVPVLEAIRNWDLDAVKMLVANRSHYWMNWTHQSPLLLAVELKKRDIYDHLRTSGLTWSEAAKSELPRLADVSPDIIEDALVGTAGTSGGPPLFEGLLTAASTGNLSELDAAIKQFHTTVQSASQAPNFEYYLKTRDDYIAELKSLPDANKVMLAAIRYPAVFLRLQMEDFPVTERTIYAIMQTENRKVLEIALRDLNVRRNMRKFTQEVLLKNATRPKIVEYYAELGMLKNLPEDQIAPMKDLYERITGKKPN